MTGASRLGTGGTGSFGRGRRPETRDVSLFSRCGGRSCGALGLYDSLCVWAALSASRSGRFSLPRTAPTHRHLLRFLRRRFSSIRISRVKLRRARTSKISACASFYKLVEILSSKVSILAKFLSRLQPGRAVWEWLHLSHIQKICSKMGIQYLSNTHREHSRFLARPDKCL